MGLFGPTFWDISRSQEGRKYLEGLFNYEGLPRPKLSRVSAPEGVAADLFGRAFEYVPMPRRLQTGSIEPMQLRRFDSLSGIAYA